MALASAVSLETAHLWDSGRLLTEPIARPASIICALLISAAFMAFDVELDGG
jgi:hypothetical protein